MTLHVCKHMCIFKYMQRRYINMNIMVIFTCTFSFLFWCRFWISFGSWEAIFCVVDPWWRYKALLTAAGLEEKETKLELYVRSSSRKHFQLAPFKTSACTVSELSKKHAVKPRQCALMKQCEMVALLINIQKAVKTHFFSSILARTYRVKFLSNMKPINAAMAPPTAEAMMVASVLSTTLTADKSKGMMGKKRHITVWGHRKCTFVYSITMSSKFNRLQALQHFIYNKGWERVLRGLQV